MSDMRSRAILKAGIIPPETIQEFRRWSIPIPEVVVESNRKQALEGIQEALESHDTVMIRQTAMDALKQFDDQAKRGRLYYINGRSGKTTFADVSYMQDTIGNYILPWRDESIEDIMLDPDTYLKPAGAPRVYFLNVQELYYGDRKVFMICSPAHGVGEVSTHGD